MKKMIKLLGIIAVVVLVAFTSCNTGGGGGGGSGSGGGSGGSDGNGEKDPPEIPGFVWIKPGTFTMGSNDTQDANAQPAHQVTLSKGFYMGTHQVTQKQYFDVMGVSITELQTFVSGISTPSYGRGDNFPIYFVSWFEAIEFCNKLSVIDGLTPAYSRNGTTDPSGWGPKGSWAEVIIVSNSTGYRLPTEAQWEYACRAGTTTAWSYGNTANGDYMWYSSNSSNMTYEVGKKLPNAWGLFDMHGNVWEWCWDWYGTYGSQMPKGNDPTGSVTGYYRVMRGGSSLDVDARDLRSACRGSGLPSDGVYVGFRLVRP